MQPNRLGRVLGVSTRIAAEKLREKSAQMDRPPVPAAAHSTMSAAPPRPAPQKAASRSYAEGGRRLARGAGRFSAAFMRPFAHATGVLSLQIAGVFFVLFALYFSSHVWRLYQLDGWRDRHLLIYAGFALLFTWFAASSFWRARRKQRL